MHAGTMTVTLFLLVFFFNLENSQGPVSSTSLHPLVF